MNLNVVVGNVTYDLGMFRLREIIWLDSDNPAGEAWSNKRTTNTSLTPDDYSLSYLYVSDIVPAPAPEFNYVGKIHKQAPGFHMEDLINLIKEGIIEVPISGESLPEIDNREYLTPEVAEPLMDFVRDFLDGHGMLDTDHEWRVEDFTELAIPSRTVVLDINSGDYVILININDKREVWLEVCPEVFPTFVQRDNKFSPNEVIKVIQLNCDFRDYMYETGIEYQEEDPDAVTHRELLCHC